MQAICMKGAVMKKIFDWMSEQFNKAIERYTEQVIRNPYNRYAEGVRDGLLLGRANVLEAEAKWEAECCEWVQEKYLNFALSTCTTSCGKRYDISEDFQYCPYCRKPIKISEVE